MDLASTQSSSFRVLGAIGLLIAIAVIAFAVYSYERDKHLTAQATSIARTFIKSSPAVEKNLGTVVKVKEKSAHRLQLQNTARRWRVEFKVTGERAHGAVDVTVRDASGNWNVPAAQLREGAGKPVDLL